MINPLCAVPFVQISWDSEVETLELQKYKYKYKYKIYL